ncbi:MAG: hypothetical protein EOO07_29475, partial [Chitinophagaceae bacterium]
MMYKKIPILCLLIGLGFVCFAQELPLVSFKASSNSLPLADQKKAAVLYLDSEADVGVKKAVNDLANDIYKVVGTLPTLSAKID